MNRRWMIVLLAGTLAPAAGWEACGAPERRWAGGLSDDEHFFPIAVWLQRPRNARRFQAAGINLYVGLWKGPTEEQLAELEAARMPVICHQNEVALRSRHRAIIAGWMHGDEPDNAQPLAQGKGYGPPVLPASIVADYERMKKRDPTRPVLLNLGQGVAWDRWRGRGVRTNHPEDYPEYIRGSDIVSFDIYPVVHRSPEVAGKLEFVARGVDRLRRWSRGEKIVWNCIEASRIHNVDVKPEPEQVRAEVWMALVHGSRGLIYFVHQFEPRFIEAALLADAELLEGVTRINRRIHELAPVLNSPSRTKVLELESSDPRVPIDYMVKSHGGSTYLFAVSMRGRKARATIRFRGKARFSAIEVLGEERQLEAANGGFTDDFDPYEVHLYRLSRSGVDD